MIAFQNCTAHSTLASYFSGELMHVKDFRRTCQQTLSRKPCANLPAALMHKEHCQTRGNLMSKIRSCHFLKLFLFYINIPLRRYNCSFAVSTFISCYSQERPCCKKWHKVLAPERNYYLAKRTAHLRKNLYPAFSSSANICLAQLHNLSEVFLKNSNRTGQLECKSVANPFTSNILVLEYFA